MHRALGIAFLVLLPQILSAESLRVVATIKPVHALVANVMKGMGSPELLVTSSASPHDYSLRPSDVRRLATADVVFWVGPTLEGFLVRPLKNLGRIRNEQLLQTPGVRLLPSRVMGVDRHWHPVNEDQTRMPDGLVASHGRDDGRVTDAHIWLDPRNAIAMARRIGDVLGELAPPRRLEIEANVSALIKRLQALDAKLLDELDPVKGMPYLVFHDAYQYYERRYGLNVVGAIVASAEQRPGVRRLREIRNRIRLTEARCVFSEPQYESALVDTVIEGSGARSAILDPLGSQLQAGPESYFLLMDALTDALRGCLQDPS